MTCPLKRTMLRGYSFSNHNFLGDTLVFRGVNENQTLNGFNKHLPITPVRPSKNQHERNLQNQTLHYCIIYTLWVCVFTFVNPLDFLPQCIWYIHAFYTEFPSFSSPAALMLMFFLSLQGGNGLLGVWTSSHPTSRRVLGPIESCQKIARLVVDPELRSLFLWRLLGQHLEKNGRILQG